MYIFYAIEESSDLDPDLSDPDLLNWDPLDFYSSDPDPCILLYGSRPKSYSFF
jgi:hypothetical protein